MTHNPKLDPQAHTSSNRDQGIQVELIKPSTQQGSESRPRDPQAPCHGDPRDAALPHGLLNTDHELGTKRQGKGIGRPEPEVAKHIAAASPDFRSIVHCF